MDTHFKIPEKKDFTTYLVASALIFAVGLIYAIMFALHKPTLLSRHGFAFEFFVIVWSLVILPVTLMAYFSNLNAYHDPVKRTMTICAPEDLLDYLDKPFVICRVNNEDEDILLQGDFNEKEKFYIYLGLKRLHLAAFKQTIKSFELKHGKVVFLTFTGGPAQDSGTNSISIERIRLTKSICVKLWSIHSSEKVFDLGEIGGNECFS